MSVAGFENLTEALRAEYELGDPIFLKTFKNGFCGRTYAAVKAAFSRLVRKGVLDRFARGIYYLAEDVDVLGYKCRTQIDTRKLFEKLFISDEGRVYGFYGALTLLNKLNICEQLPGAATITTNKARKDAELLKIGKAYVRLYKPPTRTPITGENIKFQKALDLFRLGDNSTADRSQFNNLKRYLAESGITQENLTAFIKQSKNCPEKIKSALLQNISGSGVFDPQHKPYSPPIL